MGQVLTWQVRQAGIGRWEPHLLGHDRRYLYASMHRPQVPGARLGVLFAGPLFHEQPRSRRLLAEVASGFAAIGLPTLRFDFYGTGDSGGDGEETDFASMSEDLAVATAALRADAAVDHVAVVAMRGASLPVSRWVREGGDASLLVLWEPVLDGAGWLQALERADVAERHCANRYSGAPAGGGFGSDGQLMGQRTSTRLRQDIADARFDLGAAADRVRLWSVLRPRSEGTAVAVERRFDLPPDAPTFDDDVRMDSGLFVTASLKRVADELAQALWEVA